MEYFYPITISEDELNKWQIEKQVRDPERDCTKFDPLLRARELFEALDINGDGGVSEEEFIRFGFSFEDCSS